MKPAPNRNAAEEGTVGLIEAAAGSVNAAGDCPGRAKTRSEGLDTSIVRIADYEITIRGGGATTPQSKCSLKTQSKKLSRKTAVAEALSRGWSQRRFPSQVG